MRTKYLGLIAGFCAAAYFVAIGMAAYRVTENVTAQNKIAQKEFADLVDKASAAAALGFMEAPFREAVLDEVRNSRTLAAVVITGPGGPEYAAARSKGFLLETDGVPRFIERFGVSSTPLFAPLRFNGVRNATVSATTLLVNYDNLLELLRDSLVIVLVTLTVAALAFITSFFVNEPETQAANSEIPSELKENEVGSQKSSVDGDIEIPFDIPDLGLDILPDIEEKSTENTEPDVEAENPQSQIDESTFFETDQGLAQSPAPHPKEPSGLYSPRGNISWEAYIADRLAAELHRCASFEQDLVFLLMGPKSASPEWDASFESFADAAVSFFTFRDLIFEHGENGIAVILPNVDLEHGLRMADEFRNKLKRSDVLALAQTDVRVGLTSRSGRLVDVDRLLLEANRALAKATHEGEAPVVAFKSDPERYRAFIASHV